ncbi:hypothetical protein FEM48_Zijuj07G0050500 [Ziziphus jujuba var. spinosa]|uniref:Uncharacterized protein n=1 Tax=Ziziphus jujuba var. spinosa TaxID=714518 RepID=A0A978V2L8_ZIZJJ|nr:hypothetical protein FEM48_Zijuj07G0050500 [Ziziphus jujuba var. spinosa]
MTDAVLGFVLEKLENLIIREANLFHRVKDDVNLLQDDLRIMNAFLRDSEGKGDGQDMVKDLIGQIREAAFEAEDVINTYMAQVIKQRRRKLLMKFVHAFDQAVVLHHVAEKTQSVKRRIDNIYANKTKFGIDAQSHVDEETELSLQEHETYKTSDEQLKVTLHDNLKGKRYFVVMDDEWKLEFWDEIRACFPNDSNGSRILITSREKEVASYASSTPLYFLPFLDKEKSWELLCKKVFRGEKCPSNLESLGRQLAESCKGLPLSVVVLGEKFYEVRVNELSLSNSNPRRLSIQGKVDHYERISSSSTSCNSISVGSLFLFPSYFDYSSLEWALENFRFVQSLSFEASAMHHSLHPIPEEIGQLVFLRYFKISVTYDFVLLQSIPASVCKLPYLETIHVQGSIDEALPKEIWIMKQLRHLYAGQGLKLPQPPSKGGHTLSNLQVLSCVEVDEKTVILFRKSLFPNLRKLHLSSHLCWIDQSMVSEIFASLKSLQRLQILKLSWLTIGQRLDLFSLSSSSKLTKVTVLNCNRVDLITLGKLVNLRILKVRECDMSSRQLHFMAGKFPQLEVFKMIGLRDIETWELETHAMPNLQHLAIEECQNLRNLPDELWSLANLRKVELSEIPQSRGIELKPPSKVGHTLSNLKVLSFVKRFDLFSLSSSSSKLTKITFLHFMAGEFPQLEVFKMIGLRYIEAWELETHAMPKLQHLVIKRCASLRNPPDELWRLANLRMVELPDIKTDLKVKLMIKQSKMEDGYYILANSS